MLINQEVQMLDTVLDLSILEEQLASYVTDANSKRIKLYTRLLKRLLLRHSDLRSHCQSLIQDVNSLFRDNYWLKLEIQAQHVDPEDDVLFRRCLFNFAVSIDKNVIKPSVITISETNIDLLPWYRKSNVLGTELSNALNAWNEVSTLANSSTLNNAQNALKCLKLLFSSYPQIRDSILEKGISWFESTNHFRKIFQDNPINDKRKIAQSALFSVLTSYKPMLFEITTISVNDNAIDITDLAKSEPMLVNQLHNLANSDMYKGKLEHSVKSITRRFFKAVSSIQKVVKEYPESLLGKGLDNFKLDDYALLKKAKSLLAREPFRELVLLLQVHFGHEIHKHYYLETLLPFYFKKKQKFRTIDFGTVANLCPEIMEDIYKLHQSEIELLPNKNYDMETLLSRFTKLKILLTLYIIPQFKTELVKSGLRCLGANKSRIQKAIFQQIQSNVKDKSMALRSGTSYHDVIRWLMGITGQTVVEAYKLSFKRYQKHARRLKVEDLYTDNELRELVYYIETGIKKAKSNKQLVSLYFARIQLKSCWNTSPMADIELDDIATVDLPTSRNSITILIQKPRKHYDIDFYSLDGRARNSVMRDILYVRDSLTNEYRNLGDEHVQRYLFISKDKTKVSPIYAQTIIAHIKTMLLRLGCSVVYDSMRIRKNGTNHLYQDVAKHMRLYESANLHKFDTFINHYQRVSEEKTHKTLHTAIDVMQRYFTGREIDPEIKILMEDDGTTQKTPTGECTSNGGDSEAQQYNKEHRHLQGKSDGGWCSDFLACVWCKYFRTVADPEHVWQLLSYRDYVLSDMAASISDIENNEFQKEAIDALHQRVDSILAQIELKNPEAVKKGKQLLKTKGLHEFWAFAVTTAQQVGDII
ncbi:hypothetical protein WLQ65_01650 [Pseudoalteromonas piscicida]|uniref:hypothetical protein n=1 Tax=Pseudoalteromonas piscicida TaxID=43662 RepID=UPI0030C8DE69